MSIHSSGSINPSCIDLTPNQKFGDSYISQLMKYPDGTVGAIRSLSLVRNISRLRNHLGPTPSLLAKELEKTSKGAISGVGLLLLPKATYGAYQSISKLSESDNSNTERKTAVAIRDTLEAVIAWGNFGAFVSANPALRYVCQLADLGNDSADFCISACDYQRVSLLEDAASGDIKEAFTHTRKYQMLRIAKAFLSIAAAFFLVSLLF